MSIVRTRARLSIESGYGFEIVIHDVGRGCVEYGERTLHPTSKIGNQHFDSGMGTGLPHRSNAINKVLGAAITQVVTVDRGDHHIRQAKCGDGASEVCGLLRIERIGAAMADIAKRAAPRAFVTHDHERRGALSKAFTDVGATGLFADRVESVFAQDRLNFLEPR